MKKNATMYGGIVLSQKALLKLVENGYSRESAYQIIQKCALKALDGGDFKNELINEKVLTELINEMARGTTSGV